MDDGQRFVDLRQRRTRLSAAHLAELVKELRPVLLGKALRDVVCVAPRDVILFFERLPSAFHDADRLHMALDPRWPRIHPVTRRFAREEFERPLFAERARELLQGAVLDAFLSVAGDRTVTMRFRPRETSAAPAKRRRSAERELVSERPLELVFELHGTHSNAFLVDDDRRVLAVLLPGTPRARACPPGSPYVAPRVPEHESEPIGPPPHDAPMPWVDFAREVWNAPAEEERETDLRQALERRLTGALRRAEDRAEGLRARRRVADDRESVRRMGDLLKASLHLVPRGARSVRVPDYYRDPPEDVEIPLDPRKSAAENADQFYARHRKLEHAMRTLAEEIEIAESNVLAIRRAHDRLAACEGIAALVTFERDVETEGVLPSKRSSRQKPTKGAKTPERRLPYRTYRSADGLEIRVGRSASDNDELTFRCTRGNDHWFHVCGSPGSHVVVPSNRGGSGLPEQTLLDACCLALHFSRGKQSAGEVWVTQVKHVRKSKGAPPGTVMVTQGRTLRFRVEDERLRRLERSQRQYLLDRSRREDREDEDVSR